jgi:hypothetical protein
MGMNETGIARTETAIRSRAVEKTTLSENQHRSPDDVRRPDRFLVHQSDVTFAKIERKELGVAVRADQRHGAKVKEEWESISCRDFQEAGVATSLT